MRKHWIRVHPRGFRNEFFYAYGSPAQVQTALAIINNDPNAYAEKVSYSEVRPALARAKRDNLDPQWAGIYEISEDVLRRHRPKRLGDDGKIYYGGPAL